MSFLVCRFFYSAILQFQIHRAMCKASRQYEPGNPDKPLHKCDIYRQPEAGNILKCVNIDEHREILPHIFTINSIFVFIFSLTDVLWKRVHHNRGVNCYKKRLAILGSMAPHCVNTLVRWKNGCAKRIYATMNSWAGYTMAIIARAGK